jgi:peroxiredoxin
MLRVSLLVLTASVALADEAPKPRSLGERLEAIQKRHKIDEEIYARAARDLPDTEEGNKEAQELWKAFDKGQAESFQAAVDLAKSDPKSEVGLAAIEWVLTIPRAYYHPAGILAMELAAEHHAANPKIGKTIAWLGYYTPHAELYPREYAAARRLIEAVTEKNSDKTARGQAHLSIALAKIADFAVAEYRKTKNVEELAAKAEAALEKLIEDYGDCPRLVLEKAGTIGEFAKRELFELRYLRIGKVAPDIEGEDLDGEKLKLSDSRGKVTVLVFWASWCGPCMEMVPDERKMVERLKGRPFALIGVNGDRSRAVARRVAEKERMTWRSFWNGPEDSPDRISRAWNVRGWPDIYVLDDKGVIRFKEVRGSELDEAVEEVLKEVEKNRSGDKAPTAIADEAPKPRSLGERLEAIQKRHAEAKRWDRPRSDDRRVSE